MTKELDHIIGQFPASRGKLIELFNSSEDFRSLCDDYWLCNCNLVRLGQNNATDARTINSYRMLRLDLEQEIVRFLNL